MSPHEEVVSKISTRVAALFRRKQAFRIFHGSTNSTRPVHQEPVVDISAFSNILEIDKESRVAIVEPNVPMDQLVRATLGHGLIPPVVMEFPGITVGGGFAGSAGESSSFKHGYFDETITEIEMVLASGEVVTASEAENADLFKGAAGSIGTLGIVTKLRLKLMPAKRFVKLAYHPFGSLHETIGILRKATEDFTNDYVDGILFSKTHGVLMTGQLTDELPPGKVPQSFSAAKDPWFYLHVKKMPIDRVSVDYIPVAEYFGFLPFNRVTRWLLDDFLHTRVMYRALHGSNMSFLHVIQDLSLPYATVEEFVDYTSQNLNIWPLWLCPLRAVNPPTFHPYSMDKENHHLPQPMLNIGLWGAASRDIDSFVRQNRELEVRLAELGGHKVLYSHTYYTKDEFWQLYDKQWYEALREKYTATSLPTVYDKVNVDVMQWKQLQSSNWMKMLGTSWPFAGFVGFWYALKSGDYRLHRDLDWMKWRLNKED
ncbi:hypothetical protein BDV96DRAFT_620203 [Lophiotrema nucula]|uniref:Delta(24)-sterol reductase n=1 Tax=Lophiotrema nucula TaxID=690887 RepID=A0A6A5ZG79_9PLEO|nr:hypothetical protein BDV96DRAFT_620203 [Lophiotrema nucula]